MKRLSMTEIKYPSSCNAQTLVIGLFVMNACVCVCNGSLHFVLFVLSKRVLSVSGSGNGTTDEVQETQVCDLNVFVIYV